MKFQLVLALVLALACSLVASFTIPYGALSDFEVAKLYVAELNGNSNVAQNSQGEIVYPTPNTTWYVGERVNVTFAQDAPDETVSIFFFNKTETLAGGPVNQTSFPFDVPSSAYSGPNSTSLLLAVRRLNKYLQTVDSVVVHVLAQAP